MEAPIERQMSETRRKILELLKRNGAMTANELSAALHITAMGVRRHLMALERDGLIHSTTVHRKMGRPSYLYSLTEHGDEFFPRTYAQFADSLLETIRAADGEAGVTKIFDKRTELLAAQYRARLAGKTLRERVAELAQIRTEEGYMADWEGLDEETFLLKEHNCAICQIAHHWPAACAHELELFQRVLDDADVIRQKHIIKGDSACIYLIRRRGAQAKR